MLFRIRHCGFKVHWSQLIFLTCNLRYFGISESIALAFCNPQKQVLDDRIEGVVFRVEEFKSQLEHVQRNMISNAEKVDDLHSHVQQLKDLYARVDQVQVYVCF